MIFLLGGSPLFVRQVGHEFEPSGLGESSLADAILSAVGVAHG